MQSSCRCLASTGVACALELDLPRTSIVGMGCLHALPRRGLSHDGCVVGGTTFLGRSHWCRLLAVVEVSHEWTLARLCTGGLHGHCITWSPLCRFDISKLLAAGLQRHAAGHRHDICSRELRHYNGETRIIVTMGDLRMMFSGGRKL